MATYVLLALALFAGLACSSPASRITEGSTSNIEKWPSMVQIDFRGTSTGIWLQSCGGNILTSRYIISAAHCFHGIHYAPQNRRIRAGSSYRNTGGMVVNVDMELNHPSYGLNDMDGDISVVRLTEALVYSDVIKQGKLVAQGFEFPDGLPVVIAEWGGTQPGSSGSEELQEGWVYIGEHQTCVDRYNSLPIPRQISNNMICGTKEPFGYRIGRTNACSGDFGGPMYFDDYLAGVLSFSEGCSDPSFPVVATKISAYTDWIVANVN